MRDDIPLDELNRAPEPGLNFGFPYCHAGTISDAEFGRCSHPTRRQWKAIRSCQRWTIPGGGGEGHPAGEAVVVRGRSHLSRC